MRTNPLATVFRVCAAGALPAILLFFESARAAESSNATDYAVAAHWMAVPAATNQRVDVFYLYPTAWTNSGPVPEYCAIDDPQMLSNAPAAFARQATVFEPLANLYAPFYRQANLTPNDPVYVAGIPTTDATAAFDYYIRHFNNGRPFILAGHSQGANALAYLLSGYVKTNAALCARMIAAYVIGYPVTAEYLANNPHLKFAASSNDTGVIISYNTQAPNVAPAANPILWGLTGIVINPILWTRDTTLATTNQGCGSFMPNASGVCERVPQYADARVNITNGVLICSTADTNALGRITALAGAGIFHSFDYPFYYYNLRSNAAERARIFLNRYSTVGVGADYDGDGLADPALYRGDTGVWYVKLSGSGYGLVTLAFGGAGCVALSGDFDGDRKADPAIYGETNGAWQVKLSTSDYGIAALSGFGGTGDSAVPRDFDGDRQADPAICRLSNGKWTVKLSASGYAEASVSDFGAAGDQLVPGMYDSDTRADAAICDASGNWTILLSASSYITATLWGFGGSGYTSLTGDFDGDGLNDPAIYEEATATWSVKTSSSGYSTATLAGFGGAAMLVSAADYDGDGRADPTCLDTATGAWHIRLSGNGYAEAALDSGWTP